MIFKSYLSVFITLLFRIFLATAWLHTINNSTYIRSDLRKNCPHVKTARHVDLSSMSGLWYIVEYYSSIEEQSEYACMQGNFQFSEDHQYMTMNLTYVFAADPVRKKLQGNITWSIPDSKNPAHWIHFEDKYEGVYNTYILDSEYQSWSLILHCAEKAEYPRYLSALIMSRSPLLDDNFITYLREKLKNYDIDLSYLIKMNQMDCDDLMTNPNDDPLTYIINGKESEKRFRDLISRS